MDTTSQNLSTFSTLFSLDNNFAIELLDSWGVSKETQAVFQEHDLDVFCIENICDSDINELIPKSRIKDRIKFKAGLAQFKNENKSLKTCSLDTETVNSDKDSIAVGSDYSSVGSGCSCASARATSNEESFNLKEILKTTSTGQICLQYMNKKIDDTTLRNNLSKCIIEYFIKRKGSMDAKDYEDMSSQIVKFFPFESKDAYYVPSRKYGKSYIPARGKLVDRYHNQRRILRKSGLVKKHETSTITITETDEESQNVSLEDLNNMKLWLKFNKEPWVDVMEKWKLTRTLRKEDLSRKDKSIQDLLNEWPSIKASLGYKLVELDFDFMYPNHDLELFKKWSIFMEKALPIYNKIKSCVDNLKTLNDDSTTPDVRDYVYLKLMSSKMPPTIKIPVKTEEKKKTYYKPSIAESEKAFILHVANQSEIITKIKLRQDEHLAKGLTCQPLIVVVGSSIEEITDYYVHYESVIYKIDTLLKAVDVCFKIFHVFNLEYPTECVNVWTFIQKYFYGIDCKSDKKISSVACFMADLS